MNSPYSATASLDGAQDSNATSQDIPRKCKVRRFQESRNPQHSSWMAGKVLRDVHPSGTADEESSYFVAFRHPLYGPKEEWFFAKQKEIKFPIQ